MDNMDMLEHAGKVLCEFVWLGSSGSDLRSKTRVLESRPACVEDIPCIVVDGSSYGLAAEDEIFLKPRKLFKDPFRQGDHLLVLCDSFLANVDPTAGLLAKPVLQPTTSNTRVTCEEMMMLGAESSPVFAVEQEYSILPTQTHYNSAPCCDTASGSAVTGGWPHPHLPNPMSPFLMTPSMEQDCKNRHVSANSGRHLAERHLKFCLDAGIKVTETSQRSAVTWSYKLGPLGGLDMADELWMSRFLMLRVSEEEGLPVSFDPAAGCQGMWARACIKYSTVETRRPLSGTLAIQHQLDLLENAHLRHLLAYGKLRPHQDHYSDFNICIGTRNMNASIVVPAKTLLHQAGHYIDRRPSSNMDPYLVTSMILATTASLPLPLSNPQHPRQHFKATRCFLPVQPAHGGLSAALSGFQGAFAKEKEASFGLSGGCLTWASNAAPSICSDSEMNSEDVLIDELDKALLGPDTPPMYDGMLGGSLALGSQHQRKRRSYYKEGFDESSSTGTSPKFLS